MVLFLLSIIPTNGVSESYGNFIFNIFEKLSNNFFQT